jgi:hypothetical protein
MQIRVYAIFDGSKRLAMINAVLFVMTIGASIGLMIKSVEMFTENVNPAMLSARFSFTVCPTWIGAYWQWIIWLPGGFSKSAFKPVPISLLFKHLPTRDTCFFCASVGAASTILKGESAVICVQQWGCSRHSYIEIMSSTSSRTSLLSNMTGCICGQQVFRVGLLLILNMIVFSVRIKMPSLNSTNVTSREQPAFHSLHGRTYTDALLGF